MKNLVMRWTGTAVRQTNFTLVLLSVVIAVLAVAGFLFCSSAILYIAFGGDRVPAGIVIANNTGENIVVEINNSSYNLARGNMIDLPWFQTENTRISVHKQSGEIWDFYWVFLSIPNGLPTSSYYLTNNYYYMQLERDATLYMLPHKVNKSVEHLPLQPHGYPLSAKIRQER